MGRGPRALSELRGVINDRDRFDDELSARAKDGRLHIGLLRVTDRASCY